VEEAVKAMFVALRGDAALPAVDFACIRGHREGIQRGEIEFLDSGSCDLDPPFFSIWPLGRLRLAGEVSGYDVFPRLERRRVKLRWQSSQWLVEVEGAPAPGPTKLRIRTKRGKSSTKAKVPVKTSRVSEPRKRDSKTTQGAKKRKASRGQGFRLQEARVFRGMIGTRAYSDSPSGHYHGKAVSGSGRGARFVRGGLPSLGKRSR
jgi:hypothetical protein